MQSSPQSSILLASQAFLHHWGQYCVCVCVCVCVSQCSALTLTAASVSSQLISRITGTSVAAQRVHAALLALTVVGLGALVHLCQV